MVTSFGYVLKNSEGYYFIGYNNSSDQLRKARVYTSLKQAENTRDEINSNPHRLPKTKLDFKIFKIQIIEVEEVFNE